MTRPFLRWVGGKWKNIDKFTAYIPMSPKRFKNYFYVEPFVGSGAMLFKKQPRHAFISDINPHLINAYKVIRDHTEELINELKILDSKDCEKTYYEVRDEFNTAGKIYQSPDVKQASRLLYLNARCFNGLYRENSDGGYNAPYAKNLKGLKRICNENLFLSVSKYLRSNDIHIENVSFTGILPLIDAINATRKRFYFIDSPYYAISETANFTKYTSHDWNDDMFRELRDLVEKIDERGDYFMLCNVSVPFIKDLFSRFNQIEHWVSRSVSCKVNDRQPVKEILVMNYKIPNLLDYVPKTKREATRTR